jgi:polysaccharide biosynthesis/export protein
MKSKVYQSIGLGCIFVALAAPLGAQTRSGPDDQANSGVTASLVTSHGATIDKPHNDNFVIGNDDVLAINVWKEPDISRSIPVRSDGRISLPLVGEVQATGRTPLQLERDIAGRLRSYISEPEVTVMVQEIHSEKFNILGQVIKPGSYPLSTATTVLDAIATAGGFRDFAKQKSIYILRKGANGGESRIPFNYKKVIEGKDAQQNISLEPGDTIVVP